MNRPEPGSSGSTTDPDIRVVSRLVAAQGTLHAFSTPGGMGEFLIEALKTLPGVVACRWCSNELTAPLGDLPAAPCPVCPAATGGPPPAASTPCRLQDRPDIRSFALRTSEGYFGAVSVGVAPNGAFQNYAPFVANLVNTAAINLESRWHKTRLEQSNAELREHQQHLEELVGHRTQELEQEVEQRREIALRLRENEARLKHLAHHDPLTDLPNRLLLYDRMEQAIGRARRADTQFAVLFLDLDRFKIVNDTLGHDTGDRLLREVASRFVSCIRESDTIARWGGDEFVILVEQLHDLRDATLLASKILRSLEQPIGPADDPLFTTVSLGISVFPDDALDTQGLMKCADVALYRAKDEGKNSYRFYRREMDARSRELLRLEADLRMALGRDQLVLYFQPQIDTDSGKCVGLEALVRWRHPSLGLVPPGDFVPIAEETGLIDPIGRWVLRTACRQAKAWQDRGLEPVPICVNVSARQLRDGRLAHEVAESLEDSGLEARHLQLEITESSVMRNIELAAAVLEDLTRWGTSIAIDDYGTGYSNLSQLKRFPIGTLKLDRSLVQDAHRDPKDAAVIASVLTLARGMGLAVVAEGVETREQLDFLRREGCQVVQGFLFSCPVPAPEAERFLSRH